MWAHVDWASHLLHGGRWNQLDMVMLRKISDMIPSKTATDTTSRKMRVISDPHRPALGRRRGQNPEWGTVCTESLLQPHRAAGPWQYVSQAEPCFTDLQRPVKP